MLLELLLFTFVIYTLHQRWLHRDLIKLRNKLGSDIKSFPIIGNSYVFIGDNHRRMKGIQIFGREAIKKDSGLSIFWRGYNLSVFIADPDAASIVLKTCLEKSNYLNLAKLLIGNASIFAPVSIWRRRRRILFPCFNSKRLKHYMDIFVKQGKILVEQMKKECGMGPFSAWDYFTCYTLDAISEATSEYELYAQNNSNHPFVTAFDAILSAAAERMLQPWLHSDLIYKNLPIYSKLLHYKEYLWDCTTKLLKSRNDQIKMENCYTECASNFSDITSMTIMEQLLRSPGNDSLSEIEITEEILMLLVAGNDTSAVGASFVTMMLSRHLDVQEKVYQELLEVLGDSKRQVELEDLSRLKYLDAVIRETLRLFPPVPLVARKIDKEVLLPSGIKLVPGVEAIIHIWAIHRHPRYWGDDAEIFRPERFIDTPLTHPAAFIPFSYGARNCIGYQFAVTAMKSALCSLLTHYKILPATSPDADSNHPPIRLRYDMMMKDADRCQIKIIPREKV